MSSHLQAKDAPSLPATSIRAADLLAHGKPFVEFPQHSILDLRRLDSVARTPDSTSCAVNNINHGPKTEGGSDSFASFSDWLSRNLQAGQPFVIRDFEKLDEWDNKLFSIQKLIELSTKKNIPIRNCNTGRDLSFTLSKFADAAHQSHREFKNLYARDLQCPEAWLEQCRVLLPEEVQWGGRLDLFQWLPACARSEVMMAYVGSEGSSSGFHRCFSSTVALNLLVGSDRPVLCFGTDFESQVKYDAFMAARGASPHVDWLNIRPEELQKADFPVYIYDQKPGDLVVFPPATAHQVWNSGFMSTKMVWNILHPLSLEAGLNYVQPPFNRLCHPDVARTNLSLACAMLCLLREKGPVPPDLALLTRLFRQMIQDETIDDQPATPISLVTIPETAIATCNFCGTAIWNRHLQCSECQDFDLCLLCFLNGRSCEHVSTYSWAEIVPQETCRRVLQRAETILGCKSSPYDPVRDRPTSLGTAVNNLIRAKRRTTTKLCHLCRIDHSEWKGRRCSACAAFFCYRGLYRHFDMGSADIMRQTRPWACPKCLETCNCRCCHFPSAYVKAEKPASKRRVKPVDPRGKNMGFTDNVFDQKKRTTPVTSTTTARSTTSPSKGPKRRLPTPPPSNMAGSGAAFNNLGLSSSHAAILTPNSDNSFRSEGRCEDVQMNGDLGRTKVPRRSLDDNVGEHQRQRQRQQERTSSPPDGNTKTLHGIDYIAHMPSPSDEQISLPPLKPGRNGFGSDSIPPPPPPAAPAPAPAVSTSDPTEAAARKDVAPSHPATAPSCNRTTPSLPTPNNPTNDAKPSSTTLNNNPRDPPSTSTTSLLTPTPTATATAIEKQTTTTPPPPPSTSSSSFPTTTISALETRLSRLTHYAHDLLSLSLHDSHRLLQREIQRVQETLVLAARRERSRALVQRLEEEFPELGDVCEEIRREGGGLGYF